jgi:signal transduction histidine kinase
MSAPLYSASCGKIGSMSEIDRLRVENQRLSDEVKRLVTTESQLYEVQEHLDGQMSAYRQLYELGKKFNTSVDLNTILQMATHFVLYELNFERCLLLLKQSGANMFSIETMDGYYDDAESTSIARLVLPNASLALAPLYVGVDRVLCLPDCRRSELTSLRRLIGMDEYAILPLGGEPKNPIRLLIAGNTAGRAPYQRRVVQEGEALLGLANLASQTSTAINNASFYQALEWERRHLEEKVRERTRELSRSLDELRAAQDRLIQTEKLASLGQLTAGIAHEIKNPLNFINNFSALSQGLVDELGEVLKPAPLNDMMRQETDEIARLLKSNLEKVVRHGKRADSIVKNMLMHSRDDSGERRAVDINTLVEESLNLAYHGARAEEQGFYIRLDQKFDPGAGEAELVPQEITRVLLNLINNGFYAARKRKADDGRDDYEPQLTAATRNLGNRVEIRIRDNGSGIPSEVMEKMFNPFFTTKPPGEGTGLGLSLSYDIVVKQHAGSIEVDTQAGQFTEFRVVLPRSAHASNAETHS